MNIGFWVLFVTISASSMAFIDQSALNVALPAIQEALNATGVDLLWIVNIYQLLLGALILVGGSLGDIFGRKRVYMLGIGIFAVSSLLCGVAPSPGFLIFSRGVQGVGGALMIPGSLAIISAYFDGTKRGQAIGTWSAFTTMTSVIGPVLGGVLADAGLWRFVFFINIPLAIVAVWALIKYVPESHDESASKKLDYLGAILITVGLAGLVYGAIKVGELGVSGFSDIKALGPIISGFVAIIAFVIVERRSDHPMVPFWLFESRTFTGTNLLTLLLYGALSGALLFFPLNLVQIQGYGASQAGLAMLPFSILLILLSRWAGGLVDRYGPRVPLVIGPFIVGLGFIALSVPGVTAGPQSYWTTFLPGAILLGIGMGITVAPLTTAVMGSVPRHSAGVASGINNAVSRSAGVLATAVMGGIALVIFSQMLNTNMLDIDLSEDIRAMLIDSSQDLGNVSIPDAIATEHVPQVQQAINESFVYMFRLLMWIAAGMCWMSAVFAGFWVEKQFKAMD